MNWPTINTLCRAILLLALALPLFGESKPRKKPFLGCWMRSQEEDSSNGNQGYLHRPCTWTFPPARGRSGFILKPDGKFAIIRPSALDSRDTLWGTWRLHKTGRLKIRFPGKEANWLEYRKMETGLIRFLYH